jgi:hypothetical protein
MIEENTAHPENFTIRSAARDGIHIRDEVFALCAEYALGYKEISQLNQEI